jgi:hypothetical protein
MPDIGVFVLTCSGGAGFPMPEIGVFVLSWRGPAGACVGESAVGVLMLGAGLGRGSTVGACAIPDVRGSSSFGAL